MSREVMKMALEALESAKNNHGKLLLSDPPQDAWRFHRVDDAVSASITALRQAIEQAEKQEPVTWRDMAYANLGAVRDKMPPEQVTAVQDWLEKVYTAPPKREWVGLTDEVTQIADALRRHGLTLVKTANGYDVINLGQITAHGIREKA